MGESKIMKVRRHHNYPMVIIPQKILNAAGFKIGDYVLVETDGDVIVLSKVITASESVAKWQAKMAVTKNQYEKGVKRDESRDDSD